MIAAVELHARRAAPLSQRRNHTPALHTGTQMPWSPVTMTRLASCSCPHPLGDRRRGGEILLLHGATTVGEAVTAPLLGGNPDG